MLFLLVVVMASISNTNQGSPGEAKVPDKISRWRPIMQEYCDKYKCSDQVDLLLAVMYQEIGNTRHPRCYAKFRKLGVCP